MMAKPAKYETVTFTYAEGGMGAYTIMLTKVMPKDNGSFGRLGIRDETILYQRWDGAEFVGGPAWRMVSRTIEAEDDEYLSNLFRAIERGQVDLSEIEDGSKMYPEDIERLLEDG